VPGAGLAPRPLFYWVTDMDSFDASSAVDWLMVAIAAIAGIGAGKLLVAAAPYAYYHLITFIEGRWHGGDGN
jgi:hypothetical protein